VGTGISALVVASAEARALVSAKPGGKCLAGFSFGTIMKFQSKIRNRQTEMTIIDLRSMPI
jgi:hypothetical protein